jgi:hypothetical protein
VAVSQLLTLEINERFLTEFLVGISVMKSGSLIRKVRKVVEPIQTILQ